MMRRNRLITGLVLLGCFVFIVYSVVLYFSRLGERHIVVTVIPEDAKFKLNGKVSNTKNLYLSPGKYVFSASKEGWETDSITLTVENEDKRVGLVPSPISEDAKSWLENNPDIQLEREAIGSSNFALRGEEIEKENPIIKSLPYEDIYGPFKVDYGQSPSRVNGIYLLVSSSTPPGRIKFIEWLSQQGYDPTDLEIRYSDFYNPYNVEE